MKLISNAVITVRGIDDPFVIYDISKPDVIYLLEKSMLNDERCIENTLQRN